jgi:surface protein
MAFMFNNPDTFNGNLQKTTHPTMTKLRFRCDVMTSGNLPVNTGLIGTETWSDGVTNVLPGNSYGPTRTLQAGVNYTAIFEGTYYNLQTSSNALNKCLRSVDYWGNSTTTRSGSNLTNAINLTSVPASIPSGITNMANMFKGDTSLNDPNISQWDVSNVTDTSSMFSGATSFNQPLNNWNVSKVTTMNSMFAGAPAFNQDLSGWNTAVLTNGLLFAPASFPTNYLPPKTSK